MNYCLLVCVYVLLFQIVCKRIEGLGARQFIFDLPIRVVRGT